MLPNLKKKLLRFYHPNLNDPIKCVKSKRKDDTKKS